MYSIGKTSCSNQPMNAPPVFLGHCDLGSQLS
ncbi:hypothetical protein T11_11299, partial [Trichinella zimbabwensis]